MEALRLFGDHLVGNEMPTEIRDITRAHVRSFISTLLANYKPATASNRYRALQAFFKWAVEEEEILVSPLEGVKPPKVPLDPPPVYSENDLARLIKACEGTAYDDRRDMAIVRLLIDTGMRRDEISRLRVSDLDFDLGIALVRGKGGYHRACPFGKKTARALDRYLRARSRHRDADLPELWLGARGAMTDSGVAQLVERRANRARLAAFHMHLLRHSYVHHSLRLVGRRAT